ncbi:MAG TPA: rhodanese-like domain-containing protein [Daejeonella sp.]|uniref:rhodanese-like domain-containing protein n=1 Tax=Daejeonella sp. TaxID=2805397 RepID=UPI002ED86CB4
MHRYLFILFCLLSSPLIAQIKNPEYKQTLDSLYNHTVPLITIDEFIKTDKYNLYILDTREEDEFMVSHLKNARHVGNFWFDMRKVYDIPKNSTVVVYCSVGIRSEKIGEKLIAAGYKNVLNLYGGIFEWVNQGHPVYKQNGVQTAEIHTYNNTWDRWAERGTKVN